jgi:polyisoprenyl-teichoic acid--peptidoglycan teichoic acid transferase
MAQRIYQDINVLYTPKEAPRPKKTKKNILVWVSVILVLGFFSLFLFKAGFTISEITIEPEENSPEPIVKKELPADDPDRLNILLMGMRGQADEGDGKLLSDAMVLLSIKKNTGQVAIISLPRDLYVDIYCLNEEHRVNFAYAQGGLQCAKDTVSWLSGQYVDYAVISNFQAFERAVDTLGGVDVYLDSAFQESFQWADEGWPGSDYWTIEEINDQDQWVFKVPTGTSHLAGKEALYFVRSRFSSSDFDRMRRQQQVLMSLKKKALSLGVLTNPMKVYELLDVVGNNIRTDMPIGEILGVLSLASDLDIDNIAKLVFDSSEQGFLYEAFVSEEYVLLPIGDNWDKIRQACQDIFN